MAVEVNCNNNNIFIVNIIMGGGFLAKKTKPGCGRSSTTTEKTEKNNSEIEATNLKGEKQNMIMVGKPAPTFTAPAYHNGEFVDINLEDYKGKWVLLCFYPGDFTFV